MGSGYPKRRTPLEWAPFAQSLSSTLKVPGSCSNDLEFVDDCKAREERTPHRMAWPGQRLLICAAQLHQVCIEVLPHPREGGWHLNAVLWECLHAFHHYQLYDGLASIGSRYHDGLRCLTFAVCHVHGADPTRHHGHCQRWRNQKWRCPTTIEGIHGWCNHTRPVQSGYTGTTGPLPRPLHMGTDQGQAKEEPKYFPCPWDHLWHPFLHRWQHHPHSPGTASQEPRQAICLPTHR